MAANPPDPAPEQTPTSDPDPAAEQTPSSGPGSPPSFATVARRVSSWTSNLLATGIVLVVVLVGGRWLSDAWRGGAPEQWPPPPGLPEDLADPGRPLELGFGTAAVSMRKQVVYGGRTDARDALRRMCRAGFAEAEPATGPAGEREIALLSHIARLKPAEELPGFGLLHEFDAGFPLAVATRAAGEADSPEAAAASGTPSRRVVILGMAVPAGERTWKVFAFAPDTSAPAATADDVPLPPGAMRLLSVRGAGGRTIAFGGRGEVEDWAGFYRTWLSQAGYRDASTDTKRKNPWRVRFVTGTGPQSGSADVQFARGGDGELLGFVSLRAPRQKTKKE